MALGKKRSGKSQVIFKMPKAFWHLFLFQYLTDINMELYADNGRIAYVLFIYLSPRCGKNLPISI